MVPKNGDVPETNLNDEKDSFPELTCSNDLPPEASVQGYLICFLAAL